MYNRVLLALCILVAGCSSEKNQASHFDRLLGRPLEVTEPTFACTRSAGLDISSFRVWNLPTSVARDLESPDETFWTLPKPEPGQAEYEISPWQRPRSNLEDATVLDAALQDLEYVVQGECRGQISANIARNALAESLKRPNTYVSSKVKRVSETISVLDLAILDPDSAHLYEIYVDF